MSSASPGDERLASEIVLAWSTSCFEAMCHRLQPTFAVFARRLNDDAAWGKATSRSSSPERLATRTRKCLAVWRHLDTT